VTGGIGILWAALAAGAFSVVFNVRGRDVPASALGAAIGWGVYLLVSQRSGADGVAYFAAAAAVALYAEGASHVLSSPAGTYIACAIIPLVPGGGMYYMMSESLSGNLSGALSIGFSTLGTAGAIAAGLAIGSVAARLAKRL
jgi:uncharacterized membrane protein YjjB (DUF3815 family)